MRHIYGNRFAETDEEASLKSALEDAHKEIERWRRIAHQTPVPIVVEHGDYHELIGQTNLILQAEFDKLRNAIRVLTDIHTRDDHQIGFTVEMGARHDSFIHSKHDYIEAWKTLRNFIHKPTDPKAGG